MRIELLGFSGCPNTLTLRENVVAAIQQIDGRLAFADINQHELSESDPRRGWPAPTILVDGRDLLGMPLPTAVAAGCRIYNDGVPNAGEIVARLRRRAAGR